MKPWQKFALLASLYFSQGLPYGFFTEAVPAILTEAGTALPDIGLANLLLLPWALKLLWAPLLDRYGSARLGRRRGWILPLQMLAVGMLAALSGLSLTAQLGLVLVGFLIVNLLSATQDVATDGLAVELLDHRERGLGNGIQVAGYRVGMIAGSGFLLMLYPVLLWGGSLLTLAALLALATLPIAFHREAKPEGPAARPRLADFLGFFRRPGIWPWMLLLVLFKGGDAIATGMLTPFLLREVGLSFTELGALKGLYGVIAGLAGALVGGWAVGKLGRRRAVVGFGIVQALAVGAYTLPALGYYTQGTLYATVVADYFAGGLATAALFTMMMDVCRPGTEGSDYTTQASLAVVAPIAARSLSGFVAESIGFAGNFALSAALSLAGALLAAWLLADADFRRRLLRASGAEW